MAAPRTLKDNDTLLVVGSAPCVWDDLDNFFALEHPHDVCVINEIGRFYPCSFKHAFSFHAQLLIEYGYAGKAICHSVNRNKPTGIDYAWRLSRTSGSSSLMAARIALRHWGYKRVVVAGVPINNDGHLAGLATHDKTGNYTGIFLAAWEKFHPELKNFLRSMSGNTRDIYGAPAKEWLNDGNDC